MILDKNIDILTANENHWIGNYTDNQEDLKHLFKDTNGNIEYFEKNATHVYAIKDEFDETFQLNSKLKEIIFIIGLNSIKEIEEIYKMKNKDSYIIVIEPDVSVFNYNLNTKDFSVFKDNKVFLFVDNNVKELNLYLSRIIGGTEISKLMKNSQIYVTYFYRNFEIPKAKNFVRTIHETTRNVIDSLGNDIKDSLIGLKQNLENLKHLSESRNPANLRGELKDVPAIVVAAGPSLNKNIQHLKKAQGKAVIIAVDTIVTRLVTEGIIPDFVCSIERGSLVYEYFYKDKNIPGNVTLVAPLLIDPRVFDSFKGELLLPFRTEVNEFRWLQHILGIEGNVGMLMGMSCAHVAFGTAQLLGCSPITLIGQDLAYGSEDGETHASGTSYDKLTLSSSNKDDELTEGYSGGLVRTTRIWSLFRYWYERTIKEINLDVINATEGGAKINNTRQMSLEEMISQYCTQEIPSVYELIKSTERYEVNREKTMEAFEKEIVAFDEFNMQCVKMIYLLRELTISEKTMKKNKKNISQILSVTEALVVRLSKHQLLSHNMQSTILQYYWNINSLTDEYTLENLLLKRRYQLKVLEPIAGTISEIIDYLKISQENMMIES